MNMRFFGGTFALGLLALTGCGGSTVHPIGGGPSAGAPSDGASGSVGSGGDGGVPAASNAGAGASASGGMGSSSVDDPDPSHQIAGTWTGYIENFEFRDQSDAVTLVLNSDGTGQITFGSSPPPAPATDPEVGYLVETDNPSHSYSGPIPGFPFTLHGVQLRDSRLQFDTVSTEPWKHWCELQTSFADEVNPGFFACAHNWGFYRSNDVCSQTDPNTMQQIIVDCGKLQLCSPGAVCECSAEGCTVGTLGGGTHFDLSLNVPKSDGSVAGLDGSVHNVHLTKR